MNSIKVLDVTLRDGGCVNDFNFGQVYMEQILAAQEASGVDVIEMGYIDEAKGSTSGRTQYLNEQGRQAGQFVKGQAGATQKVLSAVSL